MSSVAQMLDMALQYHRVGNLHQAERLYRQILQLEPQHADALHFLGVIAQQVGRNDLAIDYIGQALRLQPHFPAAHNNLGMALRNQGRLAEAFAHYRAALAQQPDFAEAHSNLGIALQDQGQLADAIASYREALRHKPDFAEAHNNLGNALREQGQLDEAFLHCQRAVNLRPNYADAYRNLGIILQDQGKIDEAIALYHQVLRLQPDHAEACFNLANALQTQEQDNDAIRYYQEAIKRKPDYADAYYNLGMALQKQGKLDEAIASYQQTLRCQPDLADAYYNIGMALQEQQKLDEAIAIYRQALSLKPEFAEAYNNIGMALRDQGRLDEAIAACRQALRLKADFAEAYTNLANALGNSGQYDEADAHYLEAVRLKPDMAEAHFNRALHLFLQGNFAAAWPEYEWRWQAKGFLKKGQSTPDLGLHIWDGSDLQGRNILLHSEQGLGDTIHFARYAALLKRRGAGQVLLTCPPELHRLMRSCQGIDQVLPRIPAAGFDVAIFLLSVPRLLGTLSVEDIPADVPYLHCDPHQVERWEAWLAERGAGRPGLRVGIAWQGFTGHTGDRWRSVPLTQFAPLAEHAGIRLVSLQKGPGSEQLTQRPGLALNAGPELLDMADTAALVRCLDLVIAVDTAVVHLAGALGKPVWVAVPKVPDFRWMLRREDSPWYPTMRLFRQMERGHWDEVFQRIKMAIEHQVINDSRFVY